MSLINQMLKDLEARHDGDARARLHREVRSLPPTSGTGTKPWVLGGTLAGLLVVAGAAGWWVWSENEGAPPVAIAPPAGPAPQAAAPDAASVAAPNTTPGPAAEALPAALEPPSLAYVTERDSGLKLSAVIDQLPPTPQEKAAVAAVAPASARKVSPPPSSKQAESAPVEMRSPVAKPASVATVASGVVEKKPAGGGRERAEAEYRRAITLVNDGRVSDAIDVLLDTLRQDGGHLSARQLLVKLLIEQRRRDEALALLSEGLASHPGQTGWAMTLARLQVDRGDLPAAAETLQRSLPHGGGALADYLGFCGLVQYRLGHHAVAATHYQNAARLAPQDGRWWLGLGLALEGDAQANAAREAFARARATGSLSGELATLVDQKLR